MFDSAGYPFSLVKHHHEKEYAEDPIVSKRLFKFKSQKRRRTYHVHFHEYDYKVFVVKFHLSIHEGRPERYNVIVNDFNAFKVLKIILNIVSELLSQEELASFALIGVPKPGETGEKTQNNQRYRVTRP